MTATVRLKPSEVELYRLMRARGQWFKVRDILNVFPTNTPTKRLSSLHAARLIEKRRCPEDERYMEYRVKVTPDL